MESFELLYVMFYLIFGTGVGLYLRYDLLVESLELRRRRDFGACCAWIVFTAILWVPVVVSLIGLIVITNSLVILVKREYSRKGVSWQDCCA